MKADTERLGQLLENVGSTFREQVREMRDREEAGRREAEEYKGMLEDNIEVNRNMTAEI
jgi:Na+/phosphate symporter